MLSKNCLGCGKLFYKGSRVSISTWNQLKNCSQECRNKVFIPWNKGKKNVQVGYWKDKKRENSWLPKYSKGHIPWNKGRPSPETRGSKSPHWKGGSSFLNKCIRLTKHYCKWRTAIRIRDNYKCALCNTRSIIVDHYPFSFLEIMTKFEIKTVQQARACPDFWNINNGRVICNDCHKETDTYGYKAINKLIEASLGLRN